MSLVPLLRIGGSPSPAFCSVSRGKSQTKERVHEEERLGVIAMLMLCSKLSSFCYLWVSLSYSGDGKLSLVALYSGVVVLLVI